MIGAALIAAAHDAATQAKARAAGAKGLRIVGSIETGQELVQRFPVDDVFVGLTGNWLNQEMAVATGAIDVFAADMNCTVPTLAATCAAHGALLIPVSDLMGIPGAEPTVVFDPAKAGEQAQELIARAIGNYPQRAARGNGKPALRTGDTVAGFSTESILARARRLARPAARRDQEGHAARRRRPRELHHAARLRPGQQHGRRGPRAHQERRARAGHGLRQRRRPGRRSRGARGQGARRPRPEGRLRAARHSRRSCSFGTCTDTGRIMLLVGAIADALGVDVPALPVVATAPEYMEQKATIDAVAALAFGMYVHVNPVPFVTRRPAPRQAPHRGPAGRDRRQARRRDRPGRGRRPPCWRTSRRKRTALGI